MELTENQKNFLLETFFKDETYANWRGIATKLLVDGRCVVAGKECIWFGGIGNFIKTKTEDDYVDCLLYTFDLKNFLSSDYFQQCKIQYLTELGKKKREIELKYNELNSL